MSAKVYLLADAREKPRPEVVSVRFRIEKNGDLVIREVRDDKVTLAPIVIADEHVDDLLRRLTASRARRKNDRLYAQHPELRPKARAEGIPSCRRQRDGGRALRGAIGCRRRSGHAGQCRDAGGDFTPAICSHIGRRRTLITIAATGETFMQCSHCGGRTSP